MWHRAPWEGRATFGNGTPSQGALCHSESDSAFRAFPSLKPYRLSLKRPISRVEIGLFIYNLLVTVR